MVQQTIESKFSEYGLPNADTGRPYSDKKLPLPMTTKKTVPRDLQNEDRSTMPKSVESTVCLKDNGPEVECTKVSGPKRTEPDQLVNQSQSSSTVNGHLVYVRRKPEAEKSKSSIYVNNSENSFCSPPKKIHRTIEEKLPVKEPSFCIPEISSMPTCSLTSSPPGKSPVPSSIGKSPDYSKRTNHQQWEDRYCQLKNVLEMLDQSNQENYVQMLRSLSPESLSSQAIVLERRSIQLSLDEAKELGRVQQLDVLAKFAESSRAPTARRG